MPGVSKTHFILYVHDQAVSRAFYETVLGQQPALDVPGMTEFIIRPDTVIGLMPEQGIARLLSLEVGAFARGSIRGEIYLIVASPEVYHQRARAAGARELSALALRDWGDRVAYSLDSDGYILAFADHNNPRE